MEEKSSLLKELRVQVENLKEAILNDYDPEAVILFGSMGRGDVYEFSDVDLPVVLASEGDKKALAKNISSQLDFIITEKHIIIKTPLNFLSRMDIPGTLDHDASREGRYIYQRAGCQNGTVFSCVVSI